MEQEWKAENGNELIPRHRRVFLLVYFGTSGSLVMVLCVHASLQPLADLGVIALRGAGVTRQ